MDIALTLLFLLVLLILKGFFSGAEMALVNSDKVKLNAKANQGHRGSQFVASENRNNQPARLIQQCVQCLGVWIALSAQLLQVQARQ